MPPKCCFLHDNDQSKSCEKDAEWSIWTPPDVYNITESCTEHVGELLSDAPEFRIYPIQKND